MSRTLSDPAFTSYVLSRTACPVLVFQTPHAKLKMSSKTPTFNTPPPPVHDSLIAFPTPQILLVTLNRSKDLNCINTRGHYELDALYSWFDNEPSLRCAILTGAGRAFCAGADLKEWNSANQGASKTQNGGKEADGLSREAKERSMPSSGFGALSRRGGKKPVICAVNGICFGGGCEMIINADMVVADEGAQFGLPEVKIGVVALAGALSRLVRTVGKQRAMEMALTGRTLKADEAKEWGLVNRIVGKGKSVEEAIKLAEMVVGNSPDSVIVSREGIKMGWEGIGAEEATRWTQEVWYKRMDKGENMKEGVKSFVEKRKPRWVPSKL